ncbi:MAG TPA: 4-hydroxythreonine-4-phosphate dehydrogenase PdxA [Salinivirgaceae bacterium]|nr:4-hydroxythreonine-4-phosphate dehydrogenase PdxA [Salinivirgaceae bacterium]
MSKKPIIGITQGDINGIGYELIIKSLMNPYIYEICTPVVYGSPKVAAYHRKALEINNFSFLSVRDIDNIQVGKPNLINVLDDNVRVELGKPTQESGQASLSALDAAVDDLRIGKIDALVTAPISKKNMQEAGFQFPGHTEYLQNRINATESLMLMVANSLRVAVATGHIPLSQVTKNLSVETIVNKLELLNRSLIVDFAITRPHIAILGLNPHAGEQGLLGHEEMEIIIPAINKARDKGIIAVGPFPADGFFGAGHFAKFDAILAMYHDQGLTPFKTIEPSGVNYTAGLPIVRTSPAHGTAFDITGKNLGNEASFLNAIYLAIDVVKNREIYKEISANPLQKRSATIEQTDDLYIDQIANTNYDDPIL